MRVAGAAILSEELLIGNNPIPTSHPLIMKAREAFIPLKAFEALLARIADAIDRGNISEIYELLREAVPEFKADKRIVDLFKYATGAKDEKSATSHRSESLETRR